MAPGPPRLCPCSNDESLNVEREVDLDLLDSSETCVQFDRALGPGRSTVLLVAVAVMAVATAVAAAGCTRSCTAVLEGL